MTITKERKQQLIKDYKQSAQDTGSPELQIAILTARIQSLTEHMKGRPKDHATRRGLLGFVSKRRRLLNYLRRIDARRYTSVIERLGIRK
jgi:small subunit ribosomal protein S15